jgi:hypothetical protein
VKAFAVACFALAVPLLTGAALLRPAPRHTAGDRLRALARPFVLPFLWRGLWQARNEEPPEALAARGQQLLALLPEWTDGHVLFASELAFAASLRAGDPEAAADHVLTALALLEAAIVIHPPGAVECLAAMASMVEIRCAQDHALGNVVARRLGDEPSRVADAYLARAEALAPSTSLADRRTYLLLTVIEAALRTGDDRRALDTIEHMRRRLSGAVDEELAARWDVALQSLAGFLRGDSRITSAQLADDPLLHDMLAALRARPHR